MSQQGQRRSPPPRQPQQMERSSRRVQHLPVFLSTDPSQPWFRKKLATLPVRKRVNMPLKTEAWSRASRPGGLSLSWCSPKIEANPDPAENQRNLRDYSLTTYDAGHRSTLGHRKNKPSWPVTRPPPITRPFFFGWSRMLAD